MMLSMIAAVSENGVIGKDNSLPWHVPEDLKRFKKLTMNKPMIMGRKTFESLPGVLPGRPHIVVTSQKDYPTADNYHIVGSLTEAIELSEVFYGKCLEETMIIGGGEIYKEAMSIVDTIYLTKVHTKVKGDTYFPDIDEDVWEGAVTEEGISNHSYSFIEYFRKK